MPDKPKRRKNNKNKKKNKNNRNNVNKSDTDINEISCSNPSNATSETIDDVSENISSEFDTKSENFPLKDTSLNLNTTTNLATDIDKSENFPSENTNVNQNVVTTLSAGTDPSKSDSNSLTNKTHRLALPCESVPFESQNKEPSLVPSTYVVESPDVIKKKKKLNNDKKSKSVDNDESPTIVEITDEINTQIEGDKTLDVIDNSNIIITDAESDVEWEKTDELQDVPKLQDLAAEAFSVTTIPLEIAQCEQTKSLSPEQEKSLRCYLQTLDLATQPTNLNSLEIRTEIEQIINREIKHRLRKKGLTDDTLYNRATLSRGLDVIDEEGSSESSATSRRQSYLSDKKSDNEELEDEVFESKQILAFKPNAFSHNVSRKLIPQPCILVDAKLKEPDVTEARADWSLRTIEKLTGAEVVYLTDSSSSTSSIYDVGDDGENEEVSDSSIRIITPTIEVTDTENFLTNTFISKEMENKNVNLSKFSEDNVNKNIKEKNYINKISTGDNTNTTDVNPHEILVLSTDDIKTNLFVKDLNDTENKSSNENNNQIDKELLRSDLHKENHIENENSEKKADMYDLEIKVLKCELNDAINNLIKEVISDSESISENQKDTFSRQDSSSSVCSSQCTAKYNPNYTSLNDVSNITHEDTTTSITKQTEDVQTNISSHVKDVFKCVTGVSTENTFKDGRITKEPVALRDLCLRKISTFPFGNKILEELAHVSERLQNMSLLALQEKESSGIFKREVIDKTRELKQETNMPYFPLPDLSSIDKISLSKKNYEHGPPPIQPRNSSLKKSQDDQHWTAIPTKTEPVYVCLSPSQKMLIEKTNTNIKEEDASQLVDIHKKFVDRRGYNEKRNDIVDSTPIVPFKSQTGSRLLALIRDPSVTNNIKLSSGQKINHKGLESLPNQNHFDNKDHAGSESESNSKTYSKSFKPIPPPRPKKFSSSFYESDESSDFTDNSFQSMRSERKMFHYSTGNLSKEIENDISSIQNMHRYYSTMRDNYNKPIYPRRPSLPKDLCEQQMEYIRQKEKEVEEEIQRLEKQKINYPEIKGPRAPLISDTDQARETIFDSKYLKSAKKDFMFQDLRSRKAEKDKTSIFSKSQEELLREKMYTEYVTQMAEREQRRQQKFIKITHTPATGSKTVSKSMPSLDALESKVNNRIEKEFICRARERWHKLGIEDPQTEDERENSNNLYREPKVIEHKIKVIQAGEEKDVTKLPSHLQEFVKFTARDKEQEHGRTGESEPVPERAHVVVFCAVIILVLAVGKFFLRLLRNK